MRLNDRQKQTVLRLLRQAVQAQIDCWDAQRQIEGALSKEIDSMGEGIEDLAISCDSGADVKLEHVQGYIDSCRIIK